VEALFEFMAGNYFVSFLIIWVICETITESLGYIVRITENGVEILKSKIELVQLQRKTPNRKKKS